MLDYEYILQIFFFFMLGFAFTVGVIMAFIFMSASFYAYDSIINRIKGSS